MHLTLPRRAFDRCQRFCPEFYDADQRAAREPPTPDPILVVPAFHLREHGHQRIAQTLSRPAPDLQFGGHLIERETDAGRGQVAC